MSIAKKDRFKTEGIDVILKDVTSIPFPPETFKWNEKKFTLLGSSNKNDLLPISLDEPSIIAATNTGRIGQYIYTDHEGNLYDAFIFVDEMDDVILRSIMTRLQ